MTTAKVLELLLVGRETVDAVMEASPRLRDFLIDQQIVIVPVHWVGFINRMPNGSNFLVYCSGNIAGGMFDLIEKCTSGRHVLFYDDKLITHGHRREVSELLKAVRALIDRRNHRPGS